MSEWQIPKATRQNLPLPIPATVVLFFVFTAKLLKEFCMTLFCAESPLFRNASGLSPLVFLGEWLAANIYDHFLWLYLPHWTSVAFSKPEHFLLLGPLLPLASIYDVSISHSLSNLLTCSFSYMARFTSGLGHGSLLASCFDI